MAADWRAAVVGLQPKARLFEGASEAAIVDAERALGGAFPAAVLSLLRQTDGVLDEWEYGPIRPLSRIVEATLYWRSVDLAAEYDSPDVSLASFIAIGTDAAGGPFGFFTDPGAGGAIRHLDAEAGIFTGEQYSLEQYLRYYFAVLSSFSD